MDTARKWNYLKNILIIYKTKSQKYSSELSWHKKHKPPEKKTTHFMGEDKRNRAKKELRFETEKIDLFFDMEGSNFIG